MMQFIAINNAKTTKLENDINALCPEFGDMAKHSVSQLEMIDGSLNKPTQFPIDTTTNLKETCKTIHL